MAPEAAPLVGLWANSDKLRAVDLSRRGRGRSGLAPRGTEGPGAMLPAFALEQEKVCSLYSLCRIVLCSTELLQLPKLYDDGVCNPIDLRL